MVRHGPGREDAFHRHGIGRLEVDGCFVMLASLSAGEHEIYIATEFGEPKNMESIVTLHLTVTGSGQ